MLPQVQCFKHKVCTSSHFLTNKLEKYVYMCIYICVCALYFVRICLQYWQYLWVAIRKWNWTSISMLAVIYKKSTITTTLRTTKIATTVAQQLQLTLCTAKLLDALFSIAPPNTEATKTCRRVYLQGHLYELHFDFVIKLPATPTNVCCKIWKNSVAGEKSPPKGGVVRVHKVIECRLSVCDVTENFLDAYTFLFSWKEFILIFCFWKFLYIVIMRAFFSSVHLIAFTISALALTFFIRI